MTAVAASPPISAADMGAAVTAVAGSKTAGVPQTGESFGAILSQADADAAEPSAPDIAKIPEPSIEGIAFADAAALAATLAAAIAIRQPWMAQFDAANAPPHHDGAPPPAAPPSPPAFADGNAPSPNAAQPATSPSPRASDAAQTATSAAHGGDNATPVSANDVPVPAEQTAVTADAEPVSAAKLAAAPAHPKDEKPAHPQTDSSLDTGLPAQAQGNGPASPELASPSAAQMLAAPSASAVQMAQAQGTPSNPAPDTDAVSAALSAATQTPPRSPVSDKPKTAGEKPAIAPDTKANPARPQRASAMPSASADPAPAPASANDPSALPVKTGDATPEHTAKNEALPAANPPQANSAPSLAPHHAAPDLSANAIANAPPHAPSPDVSTPVKIAFATPMNADAPSFDALAMKIASRSANGEANFSLRLDPPELGRIEVNLNVNSDGHAQANLSADKPHTLELLQKDASALERALKDAGLNLAGGMTFSLKGEGRSQAWRDMQNGSRGRNIGIAAADAANANAAMTTSAALSARAYGLPVTLLDIRV